jgi:hypothetical protein
MEKGCRCHGVKKAMTMRQDDARRLERCAGIGDQQAAALSLTFREALSGVFRAGPRLAS